MNTTATAPSATTRRRELSIYASTAERFEDNTDLMTESDIRELRGQPRRDIMREPPRRSTGPWYSFEPDGPDAEPYAVIEATYGASPVNSGAGYACLCARVDTGGGSLVDLPAALALEHARRLSYGLRPIGGAVLDELAADVAKALAAQKAAVADRLARQEAEREAARKAAEELAERVAAVPTPRVGDVLFTWHRYVHGAGHGAALARVAPTPAMVVGVAVREGAVPPAVDVVEFGLSGRATTLTGGVPFAVEPRDGCWTHRDDSAAPGWAPAPGE